MIADLMPFAFEDHLVRVVVRGETPWFVAGDICRVLGIVNHRDACEKLDDDERDDVGLTDAIGRQQGTLVVSESGLYTIVLRSRAATTPGSVAHRFRKWVTAEVLPQVRRTGRYEPEPEVGDGAGRSILPGHPDFSQAVRLVREARLSRGATAALAVWRAIGLPWVPELEEAPAPTRGAATLPGDDAVMRFAVEGVERVEGVRTPSPMLWAAFCQFCAVHGLENYGERSFFVRFAKAGFAKRKVCGRWVYLQIRPKAMTSEAGGLG